MRINRHRYRKPVAWMMAGVCLITVTVVAIGHVKAVALTFRSRLNSGCAVMSVARMSIGTLMRVISGSAMAWSGIDFFS